MMAMMTRARRWRTFCPRSNIVDNVRSHVPESAKADGSILVPLLLVFGGLGIKARVFRV